MFKFHCPHCQQKLSAEATQSGETLQCPACGVDFVIPSPTDETVGEPQSPQESAEATSFREVQPEQSSQPESIPTPGASHSYAERLKDGNKAAQKGVKFVKAGAMVGWAGLKRRSKQAALKAQIEKLRNIDLRKAFHSLGKKAFEQDVLADGLAEQFQAIRDLDARIAEMRDKATVDAGETKMAALKRVSKDTAKASQAQALTVKREHLITELGREINARKAQTSVQEFSEEFAAINAIEHLIRDKEFEMRGLDDGGKSGIQTLAVAAVIALLTIAGALLGLNFMGDSSKQQASSRWQPGNNRTVELVGRSETTGSIDLEGKGNQYFPPNPDEAISLSNYREGDLIRESDQLADKIFLRIYLLGLRNPQVLDHFEKNYFEPTIKSQTNNPKPYQSRLLSIARLGAADSLKSKDPTKGGIPRFYVKSGDNGEYRPNDKTRLEILENYYGPKEKWKDKHGFSVASKNVEPADEIEFVGIEAAEFLGRFDKAIESHQ